MERIVVVGASLAGLRAVEGLRANGYTGALTLVGAESRLPYDRPPLSKDVLAGDTDMSQLELRAEDKWADLDVRLRLGVRATGLDIAGRAVTLEDGTSEPYDGLIVATGSVPRPFPGAVTLRTLDDALAIRTALDDGARVCVIGAGFIGAEVAATARCRGLEVSLLEALPVPLSRALGDEMGAACGALHVDFGVDLRCGVVIERVEPGQGVVLADGSLVPADIVVAGIGVVPVTDWLEGSGLTIDNGVVCDETLACVGAGGAVFAAGDIARWPNALFDDEVMRVEHWTNAVEQGDLAARNLLSGGNGEPYAPVPYFWSDQYGVKIQFVGRSAPGDEVRVVAGSVEDRKFTAIYGRNGRIVGCLGFTMPRKVMQYRRMIAARASWDDALRAD
jgi:NADPH-dependent 2,4-dienoyl-CoA reductase/sulfur reductase-like enzyme